MTDIDWAALRAAATVAMHRAYAPYSTFPVGAAGLVDDGRVVVGCNVENASYGVTLCAECGVVSALHAGGGGRLAALSCVDGAGRPLMPCGRCRQLLWEHGGPDCLVDASPAPVRVADLLPLAFGPADLAATRAAPGAPSGAPGTRPMAPGVPAGGAGVSRVSGAGAAVSGAAVGVSAGDAGVSALASGVSGAGVSALGPGVSAGGAGVSAGEAGVSAPAPAVSGAAVGVPERLAAWRGRGTVFVHMDSAGGQPVWTAYWERSTGAAADETGILEEAPNWPEAADAVAWGRARTTRVVVVDVEGTLAWAGEADPPSEIPARWPAPPP